MIHVKLLFEMFVLIPFPWFLRNMAEVAILNVVMIFLKEINSFLNGVGSTRMSLRKEKILVLVAGDVVIASDFVHMLDVLFVI